MSFVVSSSEYSIDDSSVLEVVLDPVVSVFIDSLSET